MKQTIIVLPVIALVGLLVIGCGNSNTSSLDSGNNTTVGFDVAVMRKIIDEKNNQFTQAHITGDTTFLNNIFTTDARVFAPNADAVVGRPAIAVLNLEFIGYGIKEFREETTALYGNADYLINEGNYSMIYGNDNAIDKGKFINIWKKVDGDWKLYSNIWNNNAPSTAK